MRIYKLQTTCQNPRQPNKFAVFLQNKEKNGSTQRARSVDSENHTFYSFRQGENLDLEKYFSPTAKARKNLRFDFLSQPQFTEATFELRSVPLFLHRWRA
jgi:hypothetical protein